MNRKLDSM